MFRVTNNTWIVGDAPVGVPEWTIGTYWETVLNEYNKRVVKTSGMVGVFTQDKTKVVVRCMSADSFYTNAYHLEY